MEVTCTVVPGEMPLSIIDNLLSAVECVELITRANASSWHRPNTGGNYMRVIMVDAEFANTLFARIQPFLPAEYNGHDLTYLNAHFRYSRYNTGGNFPIHRDGTNYDNDRMEEFGSSTQSVFTLNIFLNDDFEGGATTFFNDDMTVRYVAEPKAGRASLFFAQQYHCGNEVLSPHKYLLRTDVMSGMK